VLVLLAVAAGVVIVAITNNSSDDLEEQTSDLEGRCSGTEIYDIELVVAGIENEQRGYREGRGTSVVTETEIGASPYASGWMLKSLILLVKTLGMGTYDRKIGRDEIVFNRKFIANVTSTTVAAK